MKMTRVVIIILVGFIFTFISNNSQVNIASEFELPKITNVEDSDSAQ